ncbi:2'-5' RNA ligase family protein [Nocardiopsis dassonvillei]
MDVFIGHHTPCWEPGHTVLHFYAIPELDQEPGLADLVTRGRQVLTSLDGLVAPVADQWLHATVQMVAGRSTASVTETELASLIARARTEFSHVPVFTTTVGSHLASRAGTLLDLGPDEPWQQAQHAAERAIASVFGPNALAYQPPPPHITTGYATRTADSGPVTSALRRTRPTHATWRVRHIHLVDVTQDANTHTYRWRQVAAFALSEKL